MGGGNRPPGNIVLGGNRAPRQRQQNDPPPNPGWQNPQQGGNNRQPGNIGMGVNRQPRNQQQNNNNNQQGNQQNVQQQQNPGQNNPIPLPQDVEDWTIQTLRAFGWESKTKQQRQIVLDVKRSLNDMVRQAFPTGKSKALREKDSGDSDYKLFLDALQAVENSPSDSNRLTALRQAAQDYISHFGRLNKLRQLANKTLKENCETVLQNLQDLESRYTSLSNGFDQLPRPPWNSQTAMRAASLKASSDLNTVDTRSAKLLEGGGVNKAFWIERDLGPGMVKGQSNKTFIFKPQMEVTPDMRAFGPGCEASREAMTGRTSDLLSSMTGLDFGMPETHVISLTESMLPPGSIGQQDPVARTNTGEIKGSLQQFAPTNGELRDQPSSIRRRVPSESCQKIALLDTVTLNLDRHAGNLLIKGDGNNPEVVPIDHGLTFPPKGALDIVGKNLGSEKNVLLKMPGSYEDFSQEMLGKIDDIDVDVLFGAMQQEVDDIEQVHPETQGKIPPESLAISKRATLFLKRAAPQLSPAVVQIALGQNSEELLDPDIDEQEFERRADVVIQRALREKGGLKEYFLMTDEERLRMRDTLFANGWPENRGQIDENWLLANVTVALKLFKTNTLNAAARSMAERRLGQQQVANLLQQGSTLREVVARACNSVPHGQGPETIDEQAREELRACRQAFPGDLFNPDGAANAALAQRLGNWREFLQLGGMDALNDAIQALSVPPRAARALCSTLNSALGVCQSAGTIDEVGDQLPDDQDGRQARGLTLDYIDQVIAVMPNQRQGAFQQRATRLRQDLDPQNQDYDQERTQTEIEALLDESIDTVREIGLTGIEELSRTGPEHVRQNENDPTTRDALLEHLQRRVSELSANMRAGNVVATMQELQQEKLRFG